MVKLPVPVTWLPMIPVSVFAVSVNVNWLLPRLRELPLNCNPFVPL